MGATGTTHGCNWYNIGVQLVQHRGGQGYDMGATIRYDLEHILGTSYDVEGTRCSSQ